MKWKVGDAFGLTSFSDPDFINKTGYRVIEINQGISGSTEIRVMAIWKEHGLSGHDPGHLFTSSYFYAHWHRNYTQIKYKGGKPAPAKSRFLHL